MRRHLRSVLAGATSAGPEERAVALVRANAGDVLAYLERRAASPQDAADVLGETLTTAWRRVEDLPREDVAARMWLFATARMTLANYRRGHRRAQDLTARLREEVETAHRAARRPGPDPVADAVHEALAELPEQQRELVTLVHWDGFTITEAASILRINASTARGRYATAREHLRRRLAPTSAADPSDPPATRPRLAHSTR